MNEILRDGVITDEERRDLLITLKSIAGDEFAETGSAECVPADLPFDDDPHILFPERRFCFTGQFIYGTRKACHRAIEQFGAISCEGVTTQLDYLVVGSMIEPDWAHTTYGRKIETALRHIDNGHGIALISERQWTAALAQANARAA
ncbi:hypothetical protein GCM10007860_06310 [Chitiniphilus shinanonensis]|uniref:BRCT domain-containing protein n=1 Tax=Chitiniphilus shinanonensis TaxID=553088 RepID=A0ABQ6BTE7_9NEIS|nr:BRCT domain-containing protein [Chitiniphilus shinanonensis]GLS03487.1 hypothetical protein GCM10007860_06310 [Chitiniphilus shinanonensis]